MPTTERLFVPVRPEQAQAGRFLLLSSSCSWFSLKENETFFAIFSPSPRIHSQSAGTSMFAFIKSKVGQRGGFFAVDSRGTCLLRSSLKKEFFAISRPVVVVVGIPTCPPSCLLGSGRSQAAERRGGRRSESPEAATTSSLPCFQSELPWVG